MSEPVGWLRTVAVDVRTRPVARTAYGPRGTPG